MIKSTFFRIIIYFWFYSSCHAATLTGDENNIVVNIFPSAERGGLGDRVSNLYMAHKIANTYKNVTVNYFLFKDSFQADFERLDIPYWQQNKKAIDAKVTKPEQFIELTYQLGSKPFNVLVVPYHSDTLRHIESSDSDDPDGYDSDSNSSNPADIFFNNLRKNQLDIKNNEYTYNITFSTARHEGFYHQADRNLMFDKMNINYVKLTKFSEYNSEVPDKNYSDNADDGYFPDYRLYVSSRAPGKLPKSNLLNEYGKNCGEVGFSYTNEKEIMFDEYGIIDDNNEVAQSENYAKAMHQLSKQKNSPAICAFIHSKKQWSKNELESLFQTRSIKIIKDYNQSDNYFAAQIDEKLLVFFWQTLPLKENISLIAYSTLPVLVTGDMSLTLALEYRKPFLYETLSHKSHDGRSIADKTLRRLQTLSEIEMSLSNVGIDKDADYETVYGALLTVKENYNSLQKILVLGLANIQTMPENLFTLIRIKNSQYPETLKLTVYEKPFGNKTNSYIQIPYAPLSRSIGNLISLLNFMSENRPTIFDKETRINFLNEISDIGIDLLELSNVKDRKAREKIYERIADLRRSMINTEPSDWKLAFDKTIETPYKKGQKPKDSRLYHQAQSLFIQAFQRIIVYRDHSAKLTFSQASQCLQQLKDIDIAIYEGKLIQYSQAYQKLFNNIEKADCS